MRATYVLADFGCGMRFFIKFFRSRYSPDFSGTFEPPRLPHGLTARSAATRGIPRGGVGHACGHLDFRLSRTRSALSSEKSGRI